MRRGFTLLEALVAIGMMVMLVGALSLFLDDLTMTRARAARTAARTRSADALYGAVETALMTAVVDGGRMGSGVQGDASRLRVLSSRTDAGSGTVQQLARAAFSPLSATVVQWAGQGVSVERGNVRSTLPAQVRALRIRYLGDAGWEESFDSMQAGTLPLAVEVALWFGQAVPQGAGAGAGEGEGEPGDAAEADAAPEDLGPPDRVRVFAVPDAATMAAESAAGGAP
jgi:hypothetical protein